MIINRRAALNDSLAYMRTLRPVRLWNAAKVVGSYYAARLLRKPLHWGLPISVSVEPTTSCNLRCPECPSGLRAFSRPTGMLQEDVFHRILDSVARHASYLILYFQGEPYLHKRFFDLVKAARQRNLYVATSTNGHYLTEENARRTVESGLSRLIVSIDGATQETYSQYRIGGKLEKVLAGTRRVVEAKRQLSSATPHLIFQFLVVKPNEHELDEIVRMAREIGVDEVRFKTAQVYDYEDGNPLIPTNARYSRYKKGADGKYRLKHKLLNHCWKLWQGCVFTWDGRVVPCCFDKDAEHPMGSVMEEDFRTLWKGEKYTHFRRSVLKSRKEIDICRNCTEGARIWA